MPVQLGIGGGGLTVEKCTAACAEQDFAIAGVEYGQGIQYPRVCALQVLTFLQSASVVRPLRMDQHTSKESQS